MVPEISYKTLANKLSISSPTLQKEIQHLSDNLSVFHAEALLETKENDRLHLTLPLDFSIQHFFMRIYQKRWIFKLLNISFPSRRIDNETHVDLTLSEASLFVISNRSITCWRNLVFN